MKRYTVALVGCDDTTTVELEMTEDEVVFLLGLAERFDEESSYTCMPVMRVDEVTS